MKITIPRAAFKFFLLICLVVFLGALFGSVSCSLAKKPVEGADSVNTNNYANANLEFYYYIPSEILKDKKKSYPVLICIPGLSGSGKDFVCAPFKEFADKEHFLILAPSFVWDEKNWESKTSYQYPDAWSGDALLKMLDKIKEKYKISTSKLYLYGFSAGAQLALRFSLWRPNLVAACAAHAGGGTITPTEKIPVKFFISVGAQDTERIPKVSEFYWRAHNAGISVDYKQYEGGHCIPQQQITDSLAFFKENKP